MMEYQRSQEFANEFRQRDLRLLIGEVLNEETLYATYNAPDGGLESLKIEVANYYGDSTADRILKNYSLPGPDAVDQAWKDLFGRIISDGQVRAPSRALVKTLIDHGTPLDKIWRYQIAYRLSFITEKIAPKSFGVAHAMDKPFWNFSILHGPTPKERTLMDEWIEILVAFVKDDKNYVFGTKSAAEMKVATSDAAIEIEFDEKFEKLATLGDVFAGKA
ncbi:putative carboxylesterase-lipase family protein [Phaeoacremonium minimum UCRPA7]|uniref:Putative carboxylesterase-lipase family protein n=1 Tax=Phaeoacremonium minimum (strain UCR-PA7) TaxID=1286976 RepID=R8BMA8_PHAM7|nr:putative carboxylesterase-lipase family protein [Phaeoacremonium minimum UCRPA7]EOO00499.1 putative carboxylesterase-lipase family protein [Phaeoacremonium minimum UCRPA7]